LTGPKRTTSNDNHNPDGTPPLTTWADLNEELDRWTDAGLSARFWWRDDDATNDTPALQRLLKLARAANAAPAIAVIPSMIGEDLMGRGDWPANTALVQHGYAHMNHAPDGEKKAEFGDHRATADMLEDLARGWRVLSRIGLALATFVPPWNRIAAEVVGRLPEVGLRAVSTFGPRRDRHPAQDVLQVNTHIDPIDWRGTRGYRGDAEALGQAVRHLSARRNGEVDREEPTGLLTHHLVHDAACWRFVETFLETVAQHPAASWATPGEVFSP